MIYKKAICLRGTLRLHQARDFPFPHCGTRARATGHREEEKPRLQRQAEDPVWACTSSDFRKCSPQVSHIAVTSSQLSLWVVCEQRDTLLHCWRECNCSPSLWRDLMLVKTSSVHSWTRGLSSKDPSQRTRKGTQRLSQSNNVELQEQNYEKHLWEGKRDSMISGVSTTQMTR